MIALIKSIFRLIKLVIITSVVIAGVALALGAYLQNEEAVTATVEAANGNEESIAIAVMSVIALIMSIFAIKRFFSWVGGLFGGGSSYSAPSSPKLTKYYFQIKHIRADGSIDSSTSNQGPFEAAHIADAKGMLAERLAGSLKYGPDRYVISKANGGGKRYV